MRSLDRLSKAVGIAFPGAALLGLCLTLFALAAPTPDPIRTRMFFLGVLDLDQRRSVVRHAIGATDDAIKLARGRLEERARRGVDEWERVAAEGVVYELSARLEWLRWLARELRIDVDRDASK